MQKNIRYDLKKPTLDESPSHPARKESYVLTKHHSLEIIEDCGAAEDVEDEIPIHENPTDILNSNSPTNITYPEPVKPFARKNRRNDPDGIRQALT